MKYCFLLLAVFSFKSLSHEENRFIAGYKKSIDICDNAIQSGLVDTSTDYRVTKSEYCEEWWKTHKLIESKFNNSQKRKNKNLKELEHTLILLQLSEIALRKIRDSALADKARRYNSKQMDILKSTLLEHHKSSLANDNYPGSELEKQTKKVLDLN